MTRYLIDSGGVIDYLKGFPPTVAFIQQLNRRGDIPCTCDTIMGEVYGGVSPQHEAVADALFSVFAYLPTPVTAAKQAGRWRYAFARQGQTLTMTDCLIAAVARMHDAPLVTRNVRDFPMPEVTLTPLPQPQRSLPALARVAASRMTRVLRTWFCVDAFASPAAKEIRSQRQISTAPYKRPPPPGGSSLIAPHSALAADAGCRLAWSHRGRGLR